LLVIVIAARHFWGRYSLAASAEVMAKSLPIAAPTLVLGWLRRRFLRTLTSRDSAVFGCHCAVGTSSSCFWSDWNWTRLVANSRTRSLHSLSHASIVVPFLLGAGLALWLYPRFAERSISFDRVCSVYWRRHVGHRVSGPGADSTDTKNANDRMVCWPSDAPP